jgi:hypothetical protein
MAICKYKATWNMEMQKEFKIPKGYIIHKIKEQDIEDARKEYKRLNEIQNKRKKKDENKKDIEIDITVEIHYKKRTPKMNSLSWGLYQMEAEFINYSLKGSRENYADAHRLYEHDVYIYGKRAEIENKPDIIKMIAKDYSFHKIEKLSDDKWKLIIWKSNSHMDTKEFAECIERQINRMAKIGIPMEYSANMKALFKDFKQAMNDNKIIIHDDIVSGRDYKILNPLCEACGNYIANEGGSLAHIKARGMGGNPEKWKEYSSNWLHMCDTCHNLFDNGQGRDRFLKKFPWLKYKVETALLRKYEDIHQEPLETAITSDYERDPEGRDLDIF